MESTTRSNNAGRIALAAILVLSLAGAAVLGAKAYWVAITPAQIASVYNQQGIEPSVSQSNIDFDALSAQNSDVCAWLYQPTQGINMPVVKSQADAAFYEDHDAMGVKSSQGAAFFSQYNDTNMTDAVTVLYADEASELGSKLIALEGEITFGESRQLYLFTKGILRIYTVASAFRSDDQDILAKYNFFSTYDDLDEFESCVMNPADAISSNVASDVQLDRSSKFLVLSTYQKGTLASGHYVVCGVLSDESEL